ncbi:hypothetical protein BV898_06432 [Hypsibius exemplaris]|uniref:Uncharacterized protein n=1 Tax=Hypsibius exemplaris TaxID=2072580 RepID=A0A1W0WWT5_HYPEX|nr:hypothetical protein BV898_06432 [Hypsibius exemplaris]
MARLRALDYLHRAAIVSLVIFTVYSGSIFATSGFHLVNKNIKLQEPVPPIPSSKLPATSPAAASAKSL